VKTWYGAKLKILVQNAMVKRVKARGMRMVCKKDEMEGECIQCGIERFLCYNIGKVWYKE
jgi:hypothetical protein